MLKLWKSLEGNKTKIGFALVGIGELVSQVRPDYGFYLLVAGYVVGGVGIGDAVRRAAKPKGV
jgi:hypothetical protein